MADRGRGGGRGRGRGGGGGSSASRFSHIPGADRDKYSGGGELKAPERFLPVKLDPPPEPDDSEEETIAVESAFLARLVESPYYMKEETKVVPTGVTEVAFFPEELQTTLDPTRRVRRKVVKRNLDLSMLGGEDGDGEDGSDEDGEGAGNEEEPEDYDVDDDEGDYDAEQYFDDDQGEGEDYASGEAAF